MKTPVWTTDCDCAVQVANEKAFDLLVEVQDVQPNARLMPVDGCRDCAHRYIVLAHMGNLDELWYLMKFRLSKRPAPSIRPLHIGNEEA